jgi:kexin
MVLPMVPACAIGKIEFVEVKLTAPHAFSGDLRVRLTSPTGLVSELADARICYNDAQQAVDCGAYADFAFGSVRHMNEPVNALPPAPWSLEVTDMLAQDTGTFQSWSITFFGRP